jgi:DNA-binding MarR family transcriptional regulator
LQNELNLSSPTHDQLVKWRVFFETAMALLDVVDDELQSARGLSLRWYDVLVQLEEASEQNESGGLPMNELAARILSSKSGLTRVVDRMEEAGLVRRERPPDDRRVVRVLITPKGIETLQAAREVHHLSIHQHFTEHLSDRELTGVATALEKVHRHVRPIRPERIGARTPAARP